MEAIDLSDPVMMLMADFHIARRRSDKVVMAKVAANLREFGMGLLEYHSWEEVNNLFKIAHQSGWLQAEIEDARIRSSVG